MGVAGADENSLSGVQRGPQGRLNPGWWGGPNVRRHYKQFISYRMMLYRTNFKGLRSLQGSTIN